MFRYVKTKVANGAKRSTRYAGKVVNAAEIAETASATTGMLRQFWESRKGTDRRETFQNAVERRGLTQDDLRALHRQHSIVAHLTFFFACVAIAMGAWHYAQGSLPGALAGFGALMALLGYFLRAGFRAAQIERGDLFPFQDYLRSPLSWLPALSLPDQGKAVTKAVRHD